MTNEVVTVTRNIGTFKGSPVYVRADGVVVTQGLDIRKDCELRGDFRNWLARRGVTLPGYGDPMPSAMTIRIDR